jgi:hypothetical protein
MVSVCVPSSAREIELKVRTGSPGVVETVTYCGVAPLSISVAVV